MRGLTIIVASDDPARFRAALTLAISQTALGGKARVYCHETSVALLIQDGGVNGAVDAEGKRLAAAGLPDRAALLAMALEGGVELTACQTGLALCGVALAELVEGVAAGGLMGVMATLGEDRLVNF